jgi:hypothetical protein
MVWSLWCFEARFYFWQILNRLGHKCSMRFLAIRRVKLAGV